MESFRLKNIIILILALLSAFLLTSLAIRGNEERVARRTQQQELVSLFAADGMTLDPALIPTDTAVSTYALIRDETAERKAATFLLGDNLERTTQGGGIYTYTSQQAPPPSGTPAALTPPVLCHRRTRKHFVGISARRFLTIRRYLHWMKRAAALQRLSACGTVRRCSTPPSPLPSIRAASCPPAALCCRRPARRPPPAEALSAFAALTAFQQMRHASSSVVSSITEVSLCYELQSTTAAPMALVPSWRIVTDTATFYVNCISGTVRRA